jgi:hypothetical protein
VHPALKEDSDDEYYRKKYQYLKGKGFLKVVNYVNNLRINSQLNLQTDIKKLKQDDFRSVGEQIMNYLQEINIHFTEKGISSYEYLKFLLQIPKFSSPPPSNYEIVIGRTNLCHINEKIYKI